jgi:hypothetical protein
VSIFTVRRRLADPQAAPRMVRAERRHQVESYLLGEYDIARLKDVAEAAEYGKAGVAIEEANGLGEFPTTPPTAAIE